MTDKDQGHENLPEELVEAVERDYTLEVVPLDRRRSLPQFMPLIISLYIGFIYVFAGFSLYEANYDLAAAAGVAAFGSLIYFAYAASAGYLGARAGQTYSVLTRSVFGSIGSGLISLLLFVIYMGWAGFQGNLLAQMLGGLFGWESLLALGVIFTVVMVINNVLGFEGISLWARYVVGPLLVIWILYLVIKGFVEIDGATLSSKPEAGTTLGLSAGLTLIIGTVTWGQEPDFFRFAKPKLSWALISYFGAFLAFMLCAVGGWMIASISQDTSFGPALNAITDFSLFGFTALVVALVIVAEVGINDGNYYASINGGQNLLAGIRGWNRLYTCAIAAAGAGLFAWLVPYVITDGFYRIAAVTAIVFPTAMVIMMLDHFVVPRLFGVSRSLEKVPQWRDAGKANWPGIIALLIAMGFGAWASAVLPGQDPESVVGIPPLESWVLGGVLYLIGVAIVRARQADTRSVQVALGFSKEALEAADGVVPEARDRERVAVPAGMGE